MGQIRVGVSTEVNDNVVTMKAVLGLRDRSGDRNASYDGEVEFTVNGE